MKIILLKKYFDERPGKERIFPFPVYVVPFPVSKTSFGLLRLNENSSVKEVF